MKESISVFYSYAHEDERLRKKLETHLDLLQRQGLITAWHDGNISAGTEWTNEIRTHLNKAQIILLLVSADFIHSDFCYSNEMKRALERHESGNARVIPIILRPVDWKVAPFSKLQALPTGARPVSGGGWRNQDQAFADVAQGIRKAIDELTSKPKSHTEDVMNIPAQAIQLEQQFAENGYTGGHGPSLLLIEGNVSVVLSCPHAVKHPQRDHPRDAEIYTGALAVQLASLTSASALIYARTTKEDPNNDADGEYKRQLRELVTKSQARFVLDIHGLAQERPMQIAVGTGYGNNLLGRTDLLDVLRDVLKNAGMTNIVIDDPGFAASGPNTIGSFTSRVLQRPALQIEVHKDYRDPRRKPLEYVKMLHALSEAIHEIAKHL